MKNAHLIDVVVAILLLVGGLNWGLMGLFDMNVIASIFGMMSMLTRVIYVAIGLAAAYRVVLWLKARSK